MPGNLAELRPLVFIAAFVGFTLLLVGLMFSESPAMFSGTPENPLNLNNPLNLIGWENYGTLTLKPSQTNYYFTYGNRSVYFLYGSYTGKPIFETGTYLTVAGVMVNAEDLAWYSLNNVLESESHPEKTPVAHIMYLSKIDSDYSSGGNRSNNYNFVNTKVSFKAAFMFNETEWESPSDAFNHSELYFYYPLGISSNINIDIASPNLLTFLSQLFTFSLPGIPPFVSVLLWLMIFPALGYLAFIFALKIIGAVFGGG